MRTLIPRFVAIKYTEGRLRGSLEAGLIMADISGFTRLSELHLPHGAKGAEGLASIIDAVFAPAFDLVSSCGGFIASSAGDSFTAVIPDAALTETEALARSVLLAMRSLSLPVIIEGEELSSRFTPSVRIVATRGCLDYAIFPSTQSFLFHGEAMTRTAAALPEAPRDEVLVLPSSIPEKKPVADKTDDDSKIYKGENALLDNAIAWFGARFPHGIPPVEFREVTSVFLAIDSDEQSIETLAEECARMLVDGGGHLVCLEQGDKGLVALAVFGAPYSGEHDCLSALHAAAATIRRFAHTVRAGLSRGTVFAGCIGSSDRSFYTCLGGTINRSARLAIASDPGRVLIDGTMSEADVHFETHGHRALTLKGFDAPIAVRELGALKDSPTHSGPFVGRDGIMESFEKFVASSFREGGGKTCLILGEPGAGKSRFIAEFLKRGSCQVPIRLLSCFATYGDPFHAVKTWLSSLDEESLRHIGSGSTLASTAIAEMTGTTAPSEMPDTRDPVSRRSDLLAGLVDALLSEPELGRALVLVDDAQWMDADTSSLLAAMRESTRGSGCVIIYCTRPSPNGDYHYPGLEPNSPRFVLEPLSETDSMRLLLDLIRSASQGDECIEGARRKLELGGMDELLKTAANGNPFFISELAKLMAKECADHLDCTNYHDVASPPSRGIDLVFTRLDILSQNTRELAFLASSIGAQFDLDLLRQLADRFIGLENRGFDAAFEEGERASLWTRIWGSFVSFNHAIIADAAVARKMPSAREAIHSAIADLLEERHSNDIEHLSLEIARHREDAKQFDRALTWLRRAYGKAKVETRNETAYDIISRICALEEKSSSTILASLFLEKAELAVLLGRFDEAEDSLEKALEQARRAEDAELEFSIGERNADLLRAKGDLDGASAAIDALESMIAARGLVMNNVQKGKLANARGILAISRGDFANALPLFREARLCFRDGKDPEGETSALGNAGACLFYLEQYDDALESMRSQAELAGRTGALRESAIALNNMGAILYRTRRLEDACEQYLGAMSIYRKIGDGNGVAVALGNVGSAIQSLGFHRISGLCFETALSYLSERGERRDLVAAYSNLAGFRLLERLPDEAEILAGRQLELAMEMGDDYYIGDAKDTLEEIALLKDDSEEVEELVGDPASNTGLSHRVIVRLADLRRECGDPEGCRSLLIDACVRHGFDPDVNDITQLSPSDASFATDMLCALARLRAMEGDLDSAVALYGKAELIGTLHHCTILAAGAALGLAQCALRSGRINLASERFARSLAMVESGFWRRVMAVRLLALALGLRELPTPGLEQRKFALLASRISDELQKAGAEIPLFDTNEGTNGTSEFESFEILPRIAATPRDRAFALATRAIATNDTEARAEAKNFCEQALWKTRCTVFKKLVEAIDDGSPSLRSIFDGTIAFF